MTTCNRLPVSNTVVCALTLFLGYCWTQFSPQVAAQAQADRQPVSKSVRGELIYVPIYSSIFYENGKSTIELTATLSVHNVNPDRSLTILRADYYDTAGKLIKKHLDKPVVLNALETKNIVIDKKNTAGGTGANFLVEWQSQEDVVSPFVESIMVNASSNLGIAFTTPGKVVRQTTVATN